MRDYGLYQLYTRAFGLTFLPKAMDAETWEIATELMFSALPHEGPAVTHQLINTYRSGNISLSSHVSEIAAWIRRHNELPLAGCFADASAMYCIRMAAPINLQMVREAERTRMARDIHDALGGALAAIKFDLPPAHETGPDRSGIACRHQETIKLVVHAHVALRRIMADLRPSVLDDLGLWAALERQATEFQSRMRIQTGFKLTGAEVTIEAGRATALFRIVQDSQNNIAKHAQATAVNILATTKGTNIMIRIHDNGCGISQKKVSKAKSFGIMGMRERAQAFGGDITINSRAGAGTSVSIKLPLNDKKC